MGLSWLNEHFICKELYAPFVLEKDSDYIKDLREKYNLVLKQAIKAGADEESIKIINKFKSKILEALNCYYKTDISKCNSIIKNLIKKDIGNDPFAINTLSNSYAFHNHGGKELQFFRCRLGNPSKKYTAKEMLHLPVNLRSKSKNCRFSIPGNPSLYVSNSSYGCWIEAGFPPEIEFNVSPVVFDGDQKIFNLAVMIRDFTALNEFESNRVHCWLKLYMLSIAISYRIKEENRFFNSEYIISQSIMMACKKIGYDGIAYYSKRVDDYVFSLCSINLVLFVDYTNNYSKIANQMKIDDSFNFFLYKQLNHITLNRTYDLSSVMTGLTTNIGNYDRQYAYKETDFCKFDQFLFSTWSDEKCKNRKENIPWGNAVAKK